MGRLRDLALQHGYRSCWSTPIRNSNGAIIGTFAILHRTVGMPTHEEIEAIELITGHVADAIMWSRDPQYFADADRHRSGAPLLKLVSDNQEACDPASRLLALAEKLQLKAGDLDRYADSIAGLKPTAQDLRERCRTQPKAGRQHHVANRAHQIREARADEHVPRRTGTDTPLSEMLRHPRSRLWPNELVALVEEFEAGLSEGHVPPAFAERLG